MPAAPLCIVLDGPDGSGKSTLAEAIRVEAAKRKMTTHYEHNGYRFKDRINAYHLAALWRGLKSGAQVVILDRWWMSEEIYAQVYRGGTPWPQSGRFLDRVFQRFAGLYVIAAPPDAKVAYERAKDRKSDELYWEKNQHICELYHDLIGHVRTGHEIGSSYRKEDYGSVFKRSEDVLHYDRDEHTPEDYAAIVLDIAKTLYDKRTQKSINPVLDPNFFNLAGNLDAEVVLVGDRTNSKLRNRRLSWPFFEHAHSSLYLAKALQLAGVGEDKLLWFNAWNQGADYSLFFARSRRCRFIALGGQAADWLEAHEVDSYHRVPHPQYARRFQHRDLQGYADVLAQAITGQGKSL